MTKKKLPQFDTAKECGTYRDRDHSRKHRGNKQWQCATCQRWCWRNDMCNLFVAVPNRNGDLP